MTFHLATQYRFQPEASYSHSPEQPGRKSWTFIFHSCYQRTADLRTMSGRPFRHSGRVRPVVKVHIICKSIICYPDDGADRHAEAGVVFRNALDTSPHLRAQAKTYSTH